MRKRLMTIVGALVTLAVLVTAVVVLVQSLGDDDAERSRLAGALAMAPADSARFSWTDWTAVRREVGLDLDAASPGSAVEDLLDRGFEDDLTSTSALGASAVVMQERLGFSPATLDWELFSQGPTVATLTMRAGPDLDFDRVISSLRKAGYAEPDSPTGAWVANPVEDQITSIISPELTIIALDSEAGLLFASDSSAGVAAAVAAGEVAETDALAQDVVEAVGEPLSASLATGDQACSALAMARADATDEDEGKALVAAAGDVNPLTGFSIGAGPGGDVRVVMGFESEAQARTNAETRAVLATGPAPGQGGTFGERFTLDRVSVTGQAVALDLAPEPGAYVLSDLSNGPVLFATC
jgi:hypothetical protein